MAVYKFQRVEKANDRLVCASTSKASCHPQGAVVFIFCNIGVEEVNNIRSQKIWLFILVRVGERFLVFCPWLLWQWGEWKNVVFTIQ